MPYDRRLDKLLAFFDRQVLAPYQAQPDKYTYRTDYFEGSVTLTDSYYHQLNDAELEREYIHIQFGYRTLVSGEPCIAIFTDDLTRKSKGSIDRWVPFLVKNGDWLDYESDDRFSSWVRRYAEADWDIDNGPAFHLIEELKLINGLTLEAVGYRLYDVDDDTAVTFPEAENTWKYEDAHRDLYRILIDGLTLRCIRALGDRMGRTLDPGAVKTIKALGAILPQLKEAPDFRGPLAVVSNRRRLASHGIRSAATSMKAFQAFSADLNSCLNAVNLLRSSLEQELNMDAAHSKARQDALRRLPRIVKNPEPNYSINTALQMCGKTVEKVDVGFRHEIAHIHQSELIVIHFTDGAIMSIETGSNAGNFQCDKHPPEEFHVDFRIGWVPPR